MKPLVIEKSGRGWRVLTRVPLKKGETLKCIEGAYVVQAKTGGLSVQGRADAADDVPVIFKPKTQAKDVAFSLGRILRLGDFAYSYIEGWS